MSRIFAEDANERMPPPATKNPLSDADKEVIKRWIADGAEYKNHWAFIPPRNGPPPQVRTAQAGRATPSMSSSWPDWRQQGCNPPHRRTARP